MDHQQFYTDDRAPLYPRYGSNSPRFPASPPPKTALPGIRDIFQRGAQSQNRANPQYHFPPMDFAPPRLPSFTHPHPGPSGSSTTLHIQSAPTATLSDDDDEEFPPTHKLLSTIARPATKVAGQRRSNPDPKGKGKQILDAPRPSTSKAAGKRKAVTTTGPPETKRQKGRCNGAANYTEEDIYGLLEIVRKWLPIGGKAWNSVEDEFNEWADGNDRPRRTVKSLEAKFKQLVKTTKPTGDAEMPNYIHEAHEIENEINDKAGTRDLDDDDLVDEVIEVLSDDDIENVKPAPKKTIVKKEPGKFVARRPTADRLPSRSSRTPRLANDLLSNLSRTLDPATQAANSEECATRAFQANQLFSMAAQLREQQSVVESLRTRLAESDRDRNAAERRADKAEMLYMVSNAKVQRESGRRWASSPAPNRTPSRPVRQDVFYRDGGCATRWIGPDNDEQLYPDSPGTRVFSRYTPEPASSCQQPSSHPARQPGTSHNAGPSTSAVISAGNTNMVNNPPGSPRSSSPTI